MIENGTLIAGKYRVERTLGRGGMGYVVQALHEHLGESVAIKFMVPELSRHPEAIARFLREARAAFRIKSEHVARVLDAGEHEGAPYMVIEFLLGHDLSKELEERSKLPVAEAADFIIQVCDALAAAHALGVVHRDLKPSNLFLTRRPDGSPLIKVLDFGISKALDDPDSPPLDSLTISHRLLGSPHYMSPEQARTPKEVDARSDIWSLGVVLYELATGKKPFDGNTPVAVLSSLLSDSVTQLVHAELKSSPLLEVVQRCLHRLPSARYKDVGELAAALLPLASPRSAPLVARIEAVVRGPSPSPPAPVNPVSVAASADDGTLLSAGSTTFRDMPESVHIPLLGPVRSSIAVPALLLAGTVAVLVAVRFAWSPDSSPVMTVASSRPAPAAPRVEPLLLPPENPVPGALPSALPSATPSSSKERSAPPPQVASARSGAASNAPSAPSVRAASSAHGERMPVAPRASADPKNQPD